MAIFSDVIPALRNAEGGYTDRKNDYGSETKMGISKRAYPQLDIKNLTDSQIFDIYERDFWDKYRLDEIYNQQVTIQCFLIFINMNPIDAGKIIQRAANACSVLTPLKEDGVLGSESLQRINLLDSVRLSLSIRVELCRYYLAEVDRDKTQQINFVGWIRRALL